MEQVVDKIADLNVANEEAEGGDIDKVDNGDSVTKVDKKEKTVNVGEGRCPLCGVKMAQTNKNLQRIAKRLYSALNTK